MPFSIISLFTVYFIEYRRKGWVGTLLSLFHLFGAQINCGHLSTCCMWVNRRFYSADITAITQFKMLYDVILVMSSNPFVEQEQNSQAIHLAVVIKPEFKSASRILKG